MNRREVDKLVVSLIRTGLFRLGTTRGTPIESYRTLEIIGTSFCLEFVPKQTYNRYSIGNDATYKLCWEKKGLIWRSYDFFDMIEELPEEVSSKLLFHLDVFSASNDKRYKVGR